MQFINPASPPCRLDLLPMAGIAMVAAAALYLLAPHHREPAAPAAPPAPVTLRVSRQTDLTSITAQLTAAHDALHAAGHDPARALVILRAARALPTGKIQEAVAVAQQHGFSRFTLRADDEAAPP